MRARETFATSGPRIRVRFFGGRDFTEEDARSDLVARGYARGVPMGGMLPESASGDPPTFLSSALRDPIGAPLERLQIVKAWSLDGEVVEKIFDVACADGTQPDSETYRCQAPSVPPDLVTCAVDEASGASELMTVWTDPEFDPQARTLYYARVLEVPTCRWSTWDAIRLGVARPVGVPASIQERAVTSPIWSMPIGG
jgi:hypothetical protein